MDPMLWFLKFVLRGFLTARLEADEATFVKSNIQKHRVALWINAIACVFILLGLRDASRDAIATMITSLLAPVMVLGGAWFAVSFGAVPKKLLDVAMNTTLWMFIAFVVSLSAMFISVAFVTSAYLWPVLGLVYLSTIIGCVQYDTADGLKAGLDDALFRQSRYAVKFYKKQGINDDEPAPKEHNNEQG